MQQCGGGGKDQLMTHGENLRAEVEAGKRIQRSNILRYIALTKLNLYISGRRHIALTKPLYIRAEAGKRIQRSNILRCISLTELNLYMSGRRHIALTKPLYIRAEVGRRIQRSNILRYVALTKPLSQH